MSTKLITPPFSGSYVHLDEPFSMGDSDPKYSLQIVLPHDSPFWKEVQKEITRVAKEKWNGKIPQGMRSTINNGDETDRTEVEGCFYMTVSCDANRPPEIVDANRKPIIEPGKLYSGAIYIVSIRGYAWDNKFGKGVSFGLGNVMRIADGTPIDGRTSADDDFADVDASQFADDLEDDDADLL